MRSESQDPELRQRLRDQLQRGQFHDVDELLEKGKRLVNRSS